MDFRLIIYHTSLYFIFSGFNCDEFRLRDGDHLAIVNFGGYGMGLLFIKTGFNEDIYYLT